MTTVAVDEMRDQLVTLDDVYGLLDQTEPLHREIIDSDSKITFDIEDGWNDAFDTMEPTEEIPGIMRLNGTERALTKGGLLSAGVQFGISSSYAKTLPGPVLSDLLNYHYGDGMSSKSFGMLAVHDQVATFNRPTLTSFSNLRILDQVVGGIQEVYGDDVEILADYKIHNDLDRTDLRLIIPDTERTVSGTVMPDVPANGTDSWSTGVHLSNSLSGASQTSVETYLFRWWCTNGCTTANSDIGTWNRKSYGQDPESVYEWAREAVEDVLGGMEHKFEEIQKLAGVKVAASLTSDVLRDIFATYRVPVAQQDFVRDYLLRADEITMYTIMAAISEAANDPRLTNKNADKLMRIGGNISNFSHSSEKARAWREGNIAGMDASNPYELAY